MKSKDLIWPSQKCALKTFEIKRLKSAKSEFLNDLKDKLGKKETSLQSNKKINVSERRKKSVQSSIKFILLGRPVTKPEV